MSVGHITDDQELDAMLRELARAEPSPTYRPSSRIGPYELGERLGQGGMGVVHRARDLRLDRVVALKLLPPHLTTDVARRALLQREARAAAAIVHPNVTAVFDVGESDGIPYFAMELVHGETLHALLAQGPLTSERAMGLARQLAAGLAAAHAAGIVHRDLKPENVIVDSNGALKILDFGLAKAALQASSISEVESASGITVAGCGTRKYMAPEQALGAGVDARADVYAFGLILDELLSAELRSAGLDKLLESCLAEDPLRRPEDGAALVGVLDGLGERRRRGWPRRAAAAAVIAAALVVGGGATTRAVFARTAPAAGIEGTDVFALTSNSVEAPVLVAALSPDGAKVAYVEKRGIFLRDAHRGTAPSRALASISASALSFARDGQSLIVVLSDGGVARVSTVDGKIMALDVGPGESVALSPDGKHLALIDAGVLAVVDPVTHSRRELHRFTGFAGALAWSPSGGEILLGVMQVGDVPAELLRLDVATGRATLVMRDKRLLQEVGTLAATFSGEGKVLVGLAPTHTEDGVLRELGRAGERDLLNVGRDAIADLHASSDGSRFSFVRYKNQTDVYVADLDAHGEMAPFRRVTLSDDSERPSSFTSDGAILVVAAAPQGYRAMRFDPDTGLGEPLFGDSTRTTWPTVAPGGDVLAFGLDAVGSTDTADLSLVSSHGQSRPLAKGVSLLGRGRPPPLDRTLRCGATQCLVGAPADDGILLSDVDPATLDVAPRVTVRDVEPSWGFALSTDGQRIAIRERSKNGFAIVARDGSRVSSVAGPDGCMMQFSAFALNESALIATMICGAMKEPNQVRLLPLDGGPARILATSLGSWFSHPVLSRDGRRLAVSRMPWTSNVYVVTAPPHS